MKVLITGAFGTIGQYTAGECLKKGHTVRLFDIKTKRNKHAAAKYLRGPFSDKVEIVFGNLLNIAQVREAVKNTDAVIHLAALIPPQSERNPELARYINVAGTEHLTFAMKKQPKAPKLIFSSSVAVYGDRLNSPYIEITDPLAVNDNDEYGKHKIECEGIIRKSGLDFTIFRLSAIFSRVNLKLDPLMFEMPLSTKIEPCTAEDTAFALSAAVENDEVTGKILHLAGGETSRTTYRIFLNRMMELFGMGMNFLPEAAFSKGKFHCGYMNTAESQELLQFQRHSLDSFYEEIFASFKVKRFFIKIVMPLARMVLLLKSPYYVSYLKDLSKKKLGAARLFLRQVFLGSVLQH